MTACTSPSRDTHDDRVAFVALGALALLTILGFSGCSGSPAFADGVSAVHAAAVAEGVPVQLALAVAQTESGFRCSASSGSAHGVMQVKVATARSVGVSGNLRNCHTGAVAGVRYLRRALDISGGSWPAAIHRYNAGLGAPARRSRYVSLVMTRLR